jgi:hypothetical protein
VVVDRDVQELPARPSAAVADLWAEDALPERPEAIELLDVDVDELPRPRALVAAHRAAERPRKPRTAVPAQDLPDRRGRQPELASDDQRARVRVLARGQDPLLEPGREPPRLPLRHRRPINQRRPAAFLEATPEPIAGRSARSAGGGRRLRTHPLNNQRHEPTAGLERETHPPRRADSIMHLGLLCELGLGRPQGSPEARTRSAVSQVCRQQI